MTRERGREAEEREGRGGGEGRGRSLRVFILSRGIIQVRNKEQDIGVKGKNIPLTIKVGPHKSIGHGPIAGVRGNQ